METEFLIISIPILLHAVATLYGAFEAHQVRKSNLIEVVHDHQDRFENLWKDANELRKTIEDDEEVDLAAIEKKDSNLYNDLTHWGEKYFWLCFNEWIQAHVWKSVPKYISKNWDAGIVDAMKKPFYMQIWEREFKDKNFRGEPKFNKFIEKCAKKGL